MKVFKWGGGLAVRLPDVVIETLGLQEGEGVEIHIAGKHRIAVSRTSDIRELLARLRKYRGRLPVGFKFDRAAVHERSR